MSWIFGIFTQVHELKKQNYKIYHKKAIKTYQGSNYYIAIGGFEKNIMHHKINENNFWLMCGKGIIKDGRQYRFMQKNDWNKFYYTNLKKNELNGHFLFVKMNNKELSLENDELGLRELFYYQNNEIFVFSTKLYEVIKFVGNCKFDLKNLSGYLHFDIPIHNNTFFKNVQRLGAGGKVQVNLKQVTVQKSYWKPNRKPDKSVIDLLKKIILFPYNERKKLSLALSGGIDSRTILAFLLSEKNYNFETHTWGHIDNLDVKIAKILAKRFNFSLKVIIPEFGNEDKIISIYKKFTKDTSMVFPISYMYDLTNEYNGYYEENMVIIDGAEGEYLRRLGFTKLYWFGKRYILKKDFEKLHKIIFREKIDVFNPQIKKILYDNSRLVSHEFLSELPDPNTFGIHSWVDLFLIRSRLINKAMANQARIDSVSVNYMPFAQPDVINTLFSFPEELKYQSLINRAIFKRFSHELTKIPIEKNGVLIPFNLNYFTSNFISHTKKIFRKKQVFNIKHYIISKMKNYIYDTFNSSDAINFELYDKHKIKLLIDEHFKGKKDNSDQLNWLLSFDTWRRITIDL